LCKKHIFIIPSIRIEYLARCTYVKDYYDWGKDTNHFECNEEADENRFCIFHDEGYLKNSENLAAHEQNILSRFKQKIRRCVSKDEPLLCVGYHLPQIEVKERFTQPVVFDDAKIGFADFSECKFLSSVNFGGTEFLYDAIFTETEFHGNAYFGSCKFQQSCNFDSAVFHRDTIFSFAEFTGQEYDLTAGYFSQSEFLGPTEFSEIKVSGGIYFYQVKFCRKVTFKAASFTGRDSSKLDKIIGAADFIGVEFQEGGNFFNTKFAGEANFSESIFMQRAKFNESEFAGDVHFSDCLFPEGTDFSGATFCGKAFFKRAEFMSSSGTEAFFLRTTFMHDAEFAGVTFRGGVTFVKAKFFDLANFSSDYASERDNFAYEDFDDVFTDEENPQELASKDAEKATPSTPLPEDLEPDKETKSNFDFGIDTTSTASEPVEEEKITESKFKGYVDFTEAEFGGVANFEGVQFESIANFTRSIFKRDANFSDVEFLFRTIFSNANFISKSDFSNVKFQAVSFSLATFRDRVNFILTHFKDIADFSDSEFQRADFYLAKFDFEANFRGTTFNDEANFIKTEFSSRTRFNYALFRGDEKTYFDTADLSKVSFLNTDITKVRFGEYVAWGKKDRFRIVDEDSILQQPESFLFYWGENLAQDDAKVLGYLMQSAGLRWPNHGIRINQTAVDSLTVFSLDEEGSFTLTLDRREMIVLLNIPRSNKNYKFNVRPMDGKLAVFFKERVGLSAVTAVYRNLRENYEYRLRYDEAGKFFVKEMELRRRYREVESEKGPVIRQNSWLRRNFSLTNLYYRVADYGEDLRKPAVLSLVIFFASTLYWLLQSNPATLEPSITVDGLNRLSDSGHIGKAIERSITDSLPFFTLGNAVVLQDYIFKSFSLLSFAILAIPLRRRFERKFRH
jgi:uncharacterized protein YjbI with pentapeptide repeats